MSDGEENRLIDQPDSFGWVSILEPNALSASLSVPESWSLVAYLCVGWPEEESEQPELERVGWEARRGAVPVEER